jgi:5-methyltetrahydrofolate--homocysteine methyltransferase
VEERLQHALIKGIGDYLEADLSEALTRYPKAVAIIEGPLMEGMNRVGELFGAGKMFLPQVVKTARTMKKAVAIIEGPLMEGMNRVGELFGAGKMFLPQVVKTARTMKKAVAILQPYIEADKQQGARSAGKVLMATVKGDVHDIGKNIVAVVMACNNYEIIDLGVMVPAETIVQRALEEKVDIIGLSGLITPSLEEMAHVAAELQRAGLDIPIMIGGATTSRLHTALKIAPVYGGPVIHMKDASQNALVAAKLLHADTRDEYVATLKQEQAELRTSAAQAKPAAQTVSMQEAEQKGLKLF